MRLNERCLSQGDLRALTAKTRHVYDTSYYPYIKLLSLSIYQFRPDSK